MPAHSNKGPEGKEPESCGEGTVKSRHHLCHAAHKAHQDLHTLLSPHASALELEGLILPTDPDPQNCGPENSNLLKRDH